MSKKLILEIDKIKFESIELINSLNDEASVNAFYLLKNIASANNNFSINSTDIKQEHSSTPGSNEIAESYKQFLVASNKASSTIKDYFNEVEKFLKYLKNKGLALTDLKQAIIIRYFSELRLKRNLTQNPYSKIIIIIKGFLKFLFSREYTDKDLASFLKIPPKVETIKELLSDIDIKRIENYLGIRKEKYKFENLRDSIIFYLGIDCGLRRQEFINLNWEEICFEEKSLNIVRSKGGKSRVVFFNDKLKGFLLTYRRLTGNYDSALIRGVFGKRISKCSIQDIVTRMYKESGIYRKNLTLHSLRHTFAERLRRKGTDVNTISKLMGHSSIETTAIYLHSNKEDFKKAIL